MRVKMARFFAIGKTQPHSRRMFLAQDGPPRTRENIVRRRWDALIEVELKWQRNRNQFLPISAEDSFRKEAEPGARQIIQAQGWVGDS
jgi:hypothetical protein